MYFDSHAHLDDGRFDQDRDAIFADLQNYGVGLIMNIGCDLKSSLQSIALAHKYPFVYAAVGYHPSDLDKYSPEGWEQILELARHPKCVAIGEIGLDYYWDQSYKDLQKEVFRRQIELALALDKPVIVHDREAHADSLEIVKDYPGLRGVFHCFSGSPEMAAELLKRGWYLGFDGPITYKNARKALEVLEICPEDRILIETDSPYLSPVPMRGKRNDSRNLRYVIETIARIRGLSEEQVEAITWENGKRLFGIA